MNKFETELANWVDVIKTYVSESSQISQRLRKILRKNTNADTDEFVRVFGNINLLFEYPSAQTYFLDNFYLENEAKLLKSLFSVDNYLGRNQFCIFVKS